MDPLNGRMDYILRKFYITISHYFFKAVVEGDARDTCHVTKHGCCPNGVSSASGPHYKGCEEDADEEDDK